MSAVRPKPDIRLELVKKSANDPKRTSAAVSQPTANPRIAVWLIYTRRIARPQSVMGSKDSDISDQRGGR